MSVIIRLQNLPWSANALDIRRFFKGLSIPEGGVHIVGGEMGDAFIAFSMDEDARQAMMHDREKINEVQVRLLLSSRAEMQKIIETARQQSLRALQNVDSAVPKAPAVTTAPAPRPMPQPPVITSNSLQNILSNNLGAAPSFLAYQQQAGITLNAKPISNSLSESSSTRRSSTEASSNRERRRSNSRERRRSRSRERNDRGDRTGSSRRRRDKSRSRSRERDYKGRRSSRRSKSRDRSSERSRERSRDRNRISSRGNCNSRESETNYSNRKENTNKSSSSASGGSLEVTEKAVVPVSLWNVPPANAYQTNFGVATVKPIQSTPTDNTFAPNAINSGNLNNPFFSVATRNTMPNVLVPNSYTTAVNSKDALAPNAPTLTAATTTSIIPAFQSYSTATTNNYSINVFGSLTSSGSEPAKQFALQNPYTTALQASNFNSNSQDSNSNGSSTLKATQKTNSSTMFPGLFLDKQPAPIVEPQQKPKQQSEGISNKFSTILPQEPIAFANTNPYAQMYPNLFAQAAALGITPKSGGSSDASLPAAAKKESKQDSKPTMETCSVKASNLCGSVTYSDLRKFFGGLFIPHNGIKMVNDKHGLRIGVAYIQFSRVSSVQKAMVRHSTLLKAKPIKLDIVPDLEFEQIEDSYRPQHRFDRNNERERDRDRDRERGGGNDNSWRDAGDSSSDMLQSFTQEPFSVLYIEDIPPFATEQDIMKIFSTFSIYDILLMPSAENRREFIAYVKFSRDEEAKAALEDRSRHVIGYRKVRVRAGKVENMEKAKEKVRLANEQLRKEEEAMAEEEAKQQAIADEEMAQNEATKENNAENNTEMDMLMSSPQQDISYNRDPRQMNMSSQLDVASSKLDAPVDPRLRRQRSTLFEESAMNGSNMNSNNENSVVMPMLSNIPTSSCPIDFNGYQLSNNPAEQCFIIMKNCDYNTRINDVANLFMSSNLQLKHIEPLRNERKKSTGEFIVEFRNPRDSVIAINRFNNTVFRLRNLRVHAITPQEIADRLGKPFMSYFPGGGSGHPDGMDFVCGSGGNGQNGPGPKSMLDSRGAPVGMGGARFGGNHNNMPLRGGRGRFGLELDLRRNDMQRGGGNGIRNRGDMFQSSNFKDYEPTDDNNEGNSNGSDEEAAQLETIDVDAHVNEDDHENSPHIVDDDGAGSSDNNMSNNRMLHIMQNEGSGAIDGSIPEKFNRPGCVVAMQNVPFKADLKAIMRFFSGFELTPDDIIRRYNDDGSPTGDARVAFESPELAHDAFEAKRRKHIFNRTIYLSIM